MPGVPEGRTAIAGSETHLREGERWQGPVPDNEPVSLTVLLRRRGGGPAPSEEELFSGGYEAPSREAAQAPSRDAAREAMSAEPADIAAVEEFAREYGLIVTSVDAESRRIRLQGTAAGAKSAFGAQLCWAEDAEEKRDLSYEGSLSVPDKLAGMVVAVLGLDLRAAAKHH